MQAHKLEERWSPTTIHAAFVLPDLSSKSRGVTVHLPLLNLGWAFALSFGGGGMKKLKSKRTKWIPTAFSFRQHSDSKVPWGNTSMHAQLFLPTEQHDGSTLPTDDLEEESILHGPGGQNTGRNLIGSLLVVLARTPSAECPLPTSYTLLSSSSIKIWLTVTIQECPFVNGLFQAISNHGSEIEAQTQLVRQSGDRALNRSLTTGKLFDVKFLSSSTRSASRDFEKFLPTYTALSILEKHINHENAKLSKGWTSALTALKDHDNAGSNFIEEISCPDGDEYDLLDSDYEDEEEVLSPVEPGTSYPPPCLPDPATSHKGGTTSSCSSCSSFVMDTVIDQDLVDNQPEEDLKGPGGLSHLYSGVTVDHERTVLVKFAAHRTWHAFLWYCYTGHIEFNRLKSQAGSVRPISLTHLLDGPPSCSPKSMYRLADLIGHDDLKAKTLEAIKDRMSEVNVLEETFSVFTSRYPDVREVQLSALMKHFASPEVKKAFLKMMRKYGNIPHAEPVLSALYDRLADHKAFGGFT